MTTSAYRFPGSEDFTPEETAQAAESGVVYMLASTLDAADDHSAQLCREFMAAIFAPYLAKPTGNGAPLFKPF